MWVDLREGWREFTARTWLWGVIAIWAVIGVAVFGPALPLGAELITARHGDTGYGLVASAFGGGTNRVYAYDVAGSLVSITAGRVIAGPLTTIADGRTILYVSTVLCVVACLGMVASPAIRSLRSQEAFR